MNALRHDRSGPPGPSATGDRPAYLHSLNGMRFLVSLAVFFAHAAVLLPVPYINDALAMGTGSTFFLVLSGFTLTWLHVGGDRPAWFYGRRLARFWPSLVVAVALPLAFAVTAPGADVAHMLSAGLAAVLLVQAWIPAVVLEAPNPVTWTLSCLAFFYLLFPWTSRLLLRRPPAVLALVAAGLLVYGWTLRIALWTAVPPGTDPASLGEAQNTLLTFGFYSPLGRIHEFLFGMVAAAALRSGWRPRLSVGAVLAVLGLVYTALWLLRDADWRSAVPHDPLNLITAPLLALLLAALARSELAGRRSVLGGPVMESAGRWSLALYLFHFTVLFTIASIAYPDRALVDFFFDPMAPSWTNVGLVLIGLAVSLVLSWAAYRFFEAPIERRLRARLRRRFSLDR